MAGKSLSERMNKVLFLARITQNRRDSFRAEHYSHFNLSIKSTKILFTKHLS